MSTSSEVPSVGCPNPQCRAMFVVRAEQVGRKAKCPKCGTPFRVGVETMPPPGSSSPPTEGATPTVTGPTPADDSPSRIGRYLVTRRLGRGGMGSVYLARDPELDRDVALKVPNPGLADDPVFLQRFRREAKAAAAFHHPNFCPVYEVGQDGGGAPYLAMAYIEGRTLADRLKDGSPIPPREAAAIVRDLARALGEAHRRGIIHRDLKPQNVMVDGRGQLVIMDFGLARRDDDPALTATNAAMGTPAYMSPEQVRGDRTVGPPTDLYALGVILYELLTGRRPFVGAVSQIFVKVATEAPVPPSRLRDGTDPALEAICLRAMAKEPRGRQGSAEELAGELGEWLERVDHGQTATLPAGRAGVPGWSRRRLLLGGGAAAGVAALGGMAAFFWPRGEGGGASGGEAAVPRAVAGDWALEFDGSGAAITDYVYEGQRPITIDVVYRVSEAKELQGLVGNLSNSGQDPLQAVGMGLGVGAEQALAFCARSSDRIRVVVTGVKADPASGYVRMTATYDPSTGEATCALLGSRATNAFGAYQVERRPFLLGGAYNLRGEVLGNLRGRIAWVHLREGLPPWPAPEGAFGPPSADDGTKLLLDFTRGPDDPAIKAAIGEGRLKLDGARFVEGDPPPNREARWALEFDGDGYARTDLRYDWEGPMVIEASAAPRGDGFQTLVGNFIGEMGPGRGGASPRSAGFGVVITRDGSWSFTSKRGSELTNTPAGRVDTSGRYAYVRAGYAPRPKGLAMSVGDGPTTKGQIKADLPNTFPLVIGGNYRRPGEVTPSFTGRIRWIRVTEVSRRVVSGADEAPRPDSGTRLLLDFTKGPDDPAIRRLAEAGMFTLEGAKWVIDDSASAD